MRLARRALKNERGASRARKGASALSRKAPLTIVLWVLAVGDAFPLLWLLLSSF